MFESLFSSFLPILLDIGKGIFASDQQRKANNAMLSDKALDRQFQKDFAQHGIQWRVEDARNAGLHPLAALGANVSIPSASPVFQDSSSPLADALGNMGQDIMRALKSNVSEEQKILMDLQVERAQLENDFLRSKIRNTDQDTASMPTGSGYFMQGQGDSKKVLVGDVAGNSVSVGGRVISTDPLSSDAQTLEDRYGDVGGIIFGIMNMIKDTSDSYKRNRLKKDLDILSHPEKYPEYFSSTIRKYRTHSGPAKVYKFERR